MDFFPPKRKNVAVVERWPLSEVRLYKGNGRSFRRNDFWDKLVGKALVMIGRWYSRHNRQPIISNACPPKWSQKSLRRKLVPIPLIVHKDLFILSKGQLKAPFYPDFSLAFAKDCGTGKAGRLLPAFFFRCLSLCLFPVFASSGASLETPVKEDALKVRREH